MSKIYVVDIEEGTMDGYDVEHFCRLWREGEIVDTHRNHYGYEFYTDIEKAKALAKLYRKRNNLED